MGAGWGADAGAVAGANVAVLGATGTADAPGVVDAGAASGVVGAGAALAVGVLLAAPTEERSKGLRTEAGAGVVEGGTAAAPPAAGGVCAGFGTSSGLRKDGPVGLGSLLLLKRLHLFCSPSSSATRFSSRVKRSSRS